jgi:transposase
MKAAPVRLGIRGFKPELRKAPQRLTTLRRPGGTAIPPNMLDEIRRDMARVAAVREQIDPVECYAYSDFANLNVSAVFV